LISHEQKTSKMMKFCVAAFLLCLVQGCLVYGKEEASVKIQESLRDWDFPNDKIEDEVADEEKVDPCVTITKTPIWRKQSWFKSWQKCAGGCQVNPSCKKWSFAPDIITGVRTCRIMLTKLDRAYSGMKGCAIAFGECPPSEPYAWNNNQHCCDKKPRHEDCFLAGGYHYNTLSKVAPCCRRSMVLNCPKEFCRNNKRVG